MSKMLINIGNSANDGAGDPARTAFNKTNKNFDEIYSKMGDGENLVQPLLITGGQIIKGSLTISKPGDSLDSPPFSFTNPDGSNANINLYNDLIRFYGKYKTGPVKVCATLNIDNGDLGVLGKVVAGAVASSDNGYNQLLNGQIMTWGRFNAIAGTAPTPFSATFPITFPNACLFAVAFPMGNASTVTMGVENFTKSNCTGYSKSSVGTTEQVCLFFALGY